MNKKIFPLILLGIMLVIIIDSVIDIQKSKSEYQIEKQAYFKRDFSGILVSKSVNRGIRIILKEGDRQNRHYLYSSKNNSYTPANLFDFISRGDSIVKKPNSLDLYIYRGGRKYYFKLGEYINE